MTPATRPAGRVVLLLGVLALAACAGKPRKPDPAPDAAPAQTTTPAAKPASEPKDGGLYAPHIRDGGPPVPADVSHLVEPTPIIEPRARYGNHSPYKVLGKTYRVMDKADGYVERGIASWYGTKFHGRPTSSFEPYDMYKFTAAHKALPLPSYVRVTNLENGRSLTVRVNDRGPFHDDRIIDLSYAAAVRLGIHVKGTAPVEVRALTPGQTTSAAAPHSAARAWDESRPWLQVGSFGERDNARAMERRLTAAGLRDHRIVQARVGGNAVWRVQVGPLASEAAFRQAESALRTLGLGAAQPVRD
ncbi:MAG: septal ring lytic transglycosylase RlpA family protein [Lysobacteraceae bacterium]